MCLKGCKINAVASTELQPYKNGKEMYLGNALSRANPQDSMPQSEFCNTIEELRTEHLAISSERLQ